jgi:hypothetical protein
MIKTKPDVETNIYYKRAATARILEVSENTICRALQKNEIKSTKKPNDRHRYFSGAEILKLWKLKRF